MLILVDQDGPLANFEEDFLKEWRLQFPDFNYIPLEERNTFYVQEQHPACFKHVIEDMYVKMDGLVGRAMEKVTENDLFFVLSDHGFESFVRGVNLNAWLREEGYLVLKDDRKVSGDYFEHVDWSKTRAYTVGMGGIYINRKGREARGIVEKGKELKQKTTSAVLALENTACSGFQAFLWIDLGAHRAQ
mgnify:CR=1 FL=1